MPACVPTSPLRSTRSAPRIVATLLAATLLAAAALACTGAVGPTPMTTPPAAAPAPTSADPLAVVPLGRFRAALHTVHVTVGGQEGTFLFDSGAGLSMVSPDFAKRAGCMPWGRLSGHNMFDQRIDVPQCGPLELAASGFALHPATVGVLDIASYFPPDAPHLDGIVGLDGFGSATLTIDLPGARLVVESPGSLAARVGGHAPLAGRIGHEILGLATNLVVPVKCASGTLYFEIDTGNGGKTLVAEHAAALLGLQPGAKELQMGEIELPGYGKASIQAMVGDLILDGNLGAAFLAERVLTVDLASGHTWIAP
jgi:hypothetical protein